MNVRTRIQLAEALGADNRWYCSQACGARVDDPERLLRYFIKSGGAHDFAIRYGHAMGALNRWYCSEFYGREITDAEVLWDYYMSYGGGKTQANQQRNQTSAACSGELTLV